MSAPNDTKWGNTITGSTNTRQGCIGISKTVVDKDTTVEVIVRTWFWSKYSLYDTSNSYYYDLYKTEPTTLIGKVNINHTVGSGSGWSTSNQTLLGTYGTYVFYKGTSSAVQYFSAKITGIENFGVSSVSKVYDSVTVPALRSFTVSYNANGGSGAPSSQTKYFSKTLTLSSTQPTRTGYTFQGWSTSATGGVNYSSGGSYTANSGATLYAVWKANTFEVKFDANGGENAPSSQTKTYGVDLALTSNVPTRKDYNFLGWGVTASDRTPTYLAGATYTNNSAVTLYAVWELAYVKPRINNFWVMRCDANGNFKEDGIYCKFHFDWSTDRDGAGYRAYYKLATETDYDMGMHISLEGTSGTVNDIVKATTGNVEFDTEFAFDIKVNVTDSNGYSSTFAYLNALYMAIDVTENGRSMSFGEPAPEDDGLLKMAFPTIDVSPSVALKYKGGKFFGGNLLWQGSSLMTDASTITLPTKVSSQRTGLLLVFSRNGDYNFTSYFVPKEVVATIGNTSTTFPLCTSLFDYIGQKTLYITDTAITGHKDNDDTGKNATSGITYHNEAFFLRYVYGV